MWVGVLGLVAAACLAGCGDSDEPAADSGASDGTPTKVTFLAPARLRGLAALELGKQQGYFEAEGIELELRYDVPAPQVVANLLSGRGDFAAFSWSGLLGVTANKVPLVAISQLLRGGESKESDDPRLIALERSSVRTAADLKGKTVGLYLLGDQSEVAVRHLAQQAGLGPKDVKFAQVNLPDMSAALKAGRVDAIVLAEPFVSALASEAKIRVVEGASTALVEDGGLPTTANITSRQFLAKNKETVDAFRRASDKSVEYARTHPDEVKAFLPKYLELPPELITSVPNFYEDIDFDKLARYVEIAQGFDMLPGGVDARKITVLE